MGEVQEHAVDFEHRNDRRLREDGSYRAFLSHNSLDKPAVRQLAERLEEDGLSCFVDERDLIAGAALQLSLAEALEYSAACVVFFGPAGDGPWQRGEVQQAIVKRTYESPEYITDDE